MILLTFRDYGITWDEEIRSTYGEYIVQWYASLFRDTRALSFFNLSDQGGFFSVLQWLARRVAPFGGYETSHLINALFGVFSAVGAFKLGRRLADPGAGVVAVAFLLLTPGFYGHAFNNPVDIPTASLFIWALYYITNLIFELPRPGAASIWKLGLCIGFALALRTAAILLIAYLGFALAAWMLVRIVLTPGRRLIQRKHLLPLIGRLGRIFLSVCVIAYLSMLPWWPAAQVRPLVEPAKGLWRAGHFAFEFTVFFDGRSISNMALPRYYVAKSLLNGLPEFYFLALSAGVLVLTARLRRTRPRSAADCTRTAALLVLIASLVLPIAYTVLARPPEYDGYRHYIFLIPSLAVGAALSWMSLATRGRTAFALAVAPMAISLAITAWDMKQLHPHEYIYFNRLFAGGLREAAKNYEMDYWGNSYKEGVEWLVQNYNPTELERKIRVASCSCPASTSYFLPTDRFEYVGSVDKSDFMTGTPDVFLATSRWGCHNRLEGPILHIVERQGVPLLYVKDLRSGVAVHASAH